MAVTLLKYLVLETSAVNNYFCHNENLSLLDNWIYVPGIFWPINLWILKHVNNTKGLFFFLLDG